MFKTLPLLLALGLIAQSMAAFNPCKFNFGRGWKNNASLTGLDYVTIYGGDDAQWKSFWHGSMVENAFAAGVTPVFYGYLTAFSARKNGGLVDCDVGNPNLCTGGSAYIKANRAQILALYAEYAQNTADIIGASGASIWLIEPDLYQYSKSGSDQRGKYNGQYQSNPLTNAEVATYYHDIVTTIRAKLPNAKVAIDISPWITNPTAWYANFNLSEVDYAFTSGGRTEAGNTKIRSENPLTWAGARNITGKPIIADAGYGVGGGGTGHDAAWDSEANIKSRITDGVIAITQFNARDDWNSSVLTSLRPKLPAIGNCGVVSSSSRPSSSSIIPSSSSIAISSSSRPSSSSVVISSSSRPSSSSSSIAISSSSRPSSSSVIPSSSSMLPSSSSNGGVPGNNIIRNGDFAQGTQQWTFTLDTDLGGGGTGAVADGKYFVDVSWGGSDPASMVLSQGGLALSSGTSYKISLSVSAGQYQAGRDLTYRLVGASSTACSTTVAISETAVPTSCTFTAAAGPYTLEILAGGGYWQDVLIDDVALVVSGVAPVHRLVVSQSQSQVRLRNGSMLSIPTGASPILLLDLRGKPLQVVNGGLVDLAHRPAGIYYVSSQGQAAIKVLNQ